MSTIATNFVPYNVSKIFSRVYIWTICWAVKKFNILRIKQRFWFAISENQSFILLKLKLKAPKYSKCQEILFEYICKMLCCLATIGKAQRHFSIMANNWANHYWLTLSNLRLKKHRGFFFNSCQDEDQPSVLSWFHIFAPLNMSGCHSCSYDIGFLAHDILFNLWCWF